MIITKKYAQYYIYMYIWNYAIKSENEKWHTEKRKVVRNIQWAGGEDSGKHRRCHELTASGMKTKLYLKRANTHIQRERKSHALILHECMSLVRENFVAAPCGIWIMCLIFSFDIPNTFYHRVCAWIQHQSGKFNEQQKWQNDSIT